MRKTNAILFHLYVESKKNKTNKQTKAETDLKYRKQAGSCHRERGLEGWTKRAKGVGGIGF